MARGRVISESSVVTECGWDAERPENKQRRREDQVLGGTRHVHRRRSIQRRQPQRTGQTRCVDFNGIRCNELLLGTSSQNVVVSSTPSIGCKMLLAEDTPRRKTPPFFLSFPLQGKPSQGGSRSEMTVAESPLPPGAPCGQLTITTLIPLLSQERGRR